MPGSVPEWVESQGKPNDGLDITGLRLPVDAISTYQLIGITTVTPRVRFLSIRSWIIKAFGESGLPNSKTVFNDFALRVETAIIIAILLENPKTIYLPGSTKALAAIDEGLTTFPLERLVDGPGYTLYAGTSYNLLLSYSQNNAPPGLFAERGLPLALSFEHLIETTRFLKTLKSNPHVSSISREDLKELGVAIKMSEIGEEELTCLLACLIPSEPLEKDRQREIRRVGVYTLLLELANHHKRCPNEDDIFEAALEKESSLPPALMPVLDGYLCYRIRDAIAVVHEAVLGLVCRELGGHVSAVHHDKVIEAVLRHAGCDEGLRNLGFLTETDSIYNIDFRTFSERVIARLENKQITRGLLRWDGDLNENTLIKSVLKNKDYAAGLMPVVWLLCQHRTAEAKPDNSPLLKILFQTGAGRFGLREVIFPQLDTWTAQNPSLADVIAWLIQRTVDQHLRIAWARMFREMDKDVAILLNDSDTWQYRNKVFEGGRMESRLLDAIDWLDQLQFINKSGLTVKGNEILRHGYSVLTRYGGNA